MAAAWPQRLQHIRRLDLTAVGQPGVDDLANLLRFKSSRELKHHHRDQPFQLVMLSRIRLSKLGPTAKLAGLRPSSDRSGGVELNHSRRRGS